MGEGAVSEPGGERRAGSACCTCPYGATGREQASGSTRDEVGEYGGWFWRHCWDAMGR